MISLIDQIMASESGAIFDTPDETGKYRYVLWRRWGTGRNFAHLCGLNPSTATASLNDPTIRREIGFCQSWGVDGLIKTNAFAFRATNPDDMMRAVDPVGFYNDHWILEASAVAQFNVACWGIHGGFRGRQPQLRLRLPWKCFGLTKDGRPKHPLYLKATTPLVDWPR